MTNEEKMVWAARFACEIEKNEPATIAAIRACVTVRELRKAYQIVMEADPKTHSQSRLVEEPDFLEMVLAMGKQ